SPAPQAHAARQHRTSPRRPRFASKGLLPLRVRKPPPAPVRGQIGGEHPPPSVPPVESDIRPASRSDLPSSDRRFSAANLAVIKRSATASIPVVGRRRPSLGLCRFGHRGWARAGGCAP